MTSINTNVGALIALRNLNLTNVELEKVQDRVSTGLRVVSPKDDGSNFSIAQGLRGADFPYLVTGSAAAYSVAPVAPTRLASVRVESQPDTPIRRPGWGCAETPRRSR